MFDNLLIATTALSSFNNAALLNPFFFVTAVLALPLFFMVYLYGRDFVSRFGWTNQNAELKSGFWSVSFLVLWVILFGGNYAVIRGGISLLPVLLAVILFGSMIVVSNGLVRLKYIDKIRNKKIGWVVFFVLLLCAMFSGMTNWWGMLLQISAIICGTIVGCRITKHNSWTVFTDLIFGIMTVLVLMQPEYFRFGQLGHLTIIHLLGLMFTGFFVVTTLVTRYIKARAKIHQSAYIKLRWLFRIVSLLAVILFVSTESVPVFLGLLGAVMVLEALNVYHKKTLADSLYKQSWAWSMICLGILIVCPVISATGIVYSMFISHESKASDFWRLL